MTSSKLKLLAIAIIVGCTALSPATALEVRFERAPTLGLWAFVGSVAGVGHNPSPLIKEIFEKSEASKNPAVLDALGQIRQIHHQHFNRSYSYEGYPQSRREMSWDASRHFSYQASQSRDLREFRSRTAQVLPGAEHRRLFALLAKLEPTYRSIIWKPSEGKLKDYARKLEKLWDKARLEKLFAQTESFYRGVWPEDLGVTVYLHPIPAAKGNTSATVIEDAVLLEALLDEKELEGRVGVIFHELCHAIYESQPAAVQNEIEQTFRKAAGKSRLLAYSLLNEGLATAIGNGYAYRLVKQKENGGSWYNSPEIDQGAKAASALVRGYVGESKPLDPPFVTAWVASYEKAFPNAMREPDKRLRESIVLHDGKALSTSAIRAGLREHFRVNSLSISAPVDAGDSLQELKGAGTGPTVLIALSDAGLSQLRALSNALPQLVGEARTLKALEPGAHRTYFTPDDQPIVVIKANRPEDFARAIDALKTKGF